MRKKVKVMISMAVSAAMLLGGAVSAFANEGTTTLQTAYKSLAANTEIYAVTDDAGKDYPYYGAKWEPKGGVYYGRIARGGTVSGRYGIANLDEMAQESAVSYYYSLDDGYGLEYWSYIYGKALEDGKRAFLVNLNFPGEGGDCQPVVNGVYDAKLQADFSYLNTLNCPVLVRIGGEMNVWSNMASPESFRAAYNHIAKLARTYAPNAALVFSPNFSSAHKVDLDSFYPGDSTVDWIGTSLYYNKFAANGDTKRDGFYGVGKYGDPMLNIQQTVNLANLHKKPIIITEGGSYSSRNGVDTSAFAAERIQKAYAFLPMVYPQIKAMVYSDSNFGSTSTSYLLGSSGTVNSAYHRAVDNNPVLLRDIGGKASYYTKLSALPSAWEGNMTLAAYTYASEKLTATWYVDGKAMATAQDYPYTYRLNVDGLAPGKHTLEVKFSNGAAKAYTFQAATATATPTEDALYADGVRQTPSIYKIDGSNYFKVRDVAAILNGTEKQFAVGFDPVTKCVTLTSGQAYEATGSELMPEKSKAAVTALKSDNSIYINGKAMDLKAYKINGSNYFKLRDLAAALDFSVGYDNAVKSIRVSGYSGYEG